MKYAVRMNLKTNCCDRQKLIDFCLNSSEQYLAIGWSGVHKETEARDKITDYEVYYNEVKSCVKRINPVLNIFRDAKENDLFWTRDLMGNYWICRAIGKAVAHFVEKMDIGATLQIEAYKVGLEVPGKIKASFNRPYPGTAEKIKDQLITEYSKYIYNSKSGKSEYCYSKLEGNLIDNLPDFELEELVITYLQLKENYYVLSNSIANKSTTPKIECELISRDKPQLKKAVVQVSRDKSQLKKAVVQVKGGHETEIDALEYAQYVKDGYWVYLFAPKIKNKEEAENTIEITRDELFSFYHEFKEIIPDSITKWENLFS